MDERVSTEDRSKWRYEEGGAPFEVATRLVDLLRAPDLRERLDEVEALVVPDSWPNWRREILARKLTPPYLNELHAVSMTVRYPADGMAYVFFPVTHPDQDEAIVLPAKSPKAMYIHIATVLEIDGEWRVFQLGPMVPPRELGRDPYSW